jgi:hypothetical protein
VDAITGEGMWLCFEQSLALAEAIAIGSMEAYRRVHCRVRGRPQLMSSLMMSLEQYPFLRHRVVRSLSRRTDAFPLLVAFHVGQESLFQLLSWPMVGFGLALLAA